MSGKPTTREELINEIRLVRGKMEKKYGSLTPEQMVWPGSMDDWSVKDILAHLVDWEQRFICWYKTGLRGEAPQIPALEMSWRDLPAINQEGYLAHKDESLGSVLALSASSYKEMITLISNLSEEEIFTPNIFAWTGDSPLLAWIMANTSSHYCWAVVNIRGRNIRKGCENDFKDRTQSV